MSHRHVEFITASIASARACQSCGALVASDPALLEAHQLFHDKVKESKPKEKKKG